MSVIERAVIRLPASRAGLEFEIAVWSRYLWWLESGCQPEPQSQHAPERSIRPLTSRHWPERSSVSRPI